jgi:hypothetical protein
VAGRVFSNDLQQPFSAHFAPDQAGWSRMGPQRTDRDDPIVFSVVRHKARLPLSRRRLSGDRPSSDGGHVFHEIEPLGT